MKWKVYIDACMIRYCMQVWQLKCKCYQLRYSTCNGEKAFFKLLGMLMLCIVGSNYKYLKTRRFYEISIESEDYVLIVESYVLKKGKVVQQNGKQRQEVVITQLFFYINSVK